MEFLQNEAKGFGLGADRIVLDIVNENFKIFNKICEHVGSQSVILNLAILTQKMILIFMIINQINKKKLVKILKKL